MTTLPPPGVLLGLDRYFEWRSGQNAVFDKMLSWFHSDTRFLCAAIPAGHGKSLSALLLAKLTGTRTIILTHSIGLMQQYAEDSKSIGGTLVKGQNNFKCLRSPTLTVEQGPCHDGSVCLQRVDCPYQVQLQKALHSQIVISNYAYYLAQTNYSQGLGDFQLMTCDESTTPAFGALENFLSVHISSFEIKELPFTFPQFSPPSLALTKSKNPKLTKPDPLMYTDWGLWHPWVKSLYPIVESRAKSLESQCKPYRSAGEPIPATLSKPLRTAKALSNKLSRLSDVPDTWVVSPTNYGYKFTPRWVADSAHLLYHDTPKIMLMSAVMSHKSADAIGVPSNGQRSWLEVGSSFPVHNTQIWHLPTARMNHLSDEYDLAVWSSRIDQFIRLRLDRKGIIFTVSYQRARELVAASSYSKLMVTHTRDNVYSVVEQFKQAPAPKILVSPVVTTGWDFPAYVTGVRWILVAKLSWPDTRNAVMCARKKDDADWPAFLTMESLVQESFRASRGEEDKCEVVLVDDNFSWFWPKFRHFAPQYFRDRVRGRLSTVPGPMV